MSSPALVDLDGGGELDVSEIRKAFKVPKAAFGLFPGRVTYVLDKNGECVLSYQNLADAESHFREGTGSQKLRRWPRPPPIA